MWSLSPLDVWTSLCSKSSFSASFLASWIEWLGMTPWYAGGAAPGALDSRATGSASGKFWTLITTGGAAWRDGQTPMGRAGTRWWALELDPKWLRMMRMMMMMMMMMMMKLSPHTAIGW